MKALFTAVLIASLGLTHLYAGEVQFEGVADAGGTFNVSDTSPYTEAGLTFTPSNGESAIFDASAPASFPGDGTSWFGFASGNTITLTAVDPFELDSILVGPSSLGSGTTDFTFTGDLAGGGQLSATFTGLTTATLETFSGWSGLSDVTISSTTDAGIDNVTFDGAPEPGSAFLLMGVAGMWGVWKYRRRRA